METELQKYDGTSCRTWWHNSKPSEIPAVILSHVVVSYWSHFLDPWMSYCLLQTLLLGAVLCFFLSWWINWCWQRSHYNWNLVNPVLVIPLFLMFCGQVFMFLLKNPTDRVALAAFELNIRSSHDRSLLPVIIIQRYLPWDVIQDVLHGHVGGTCSTCTSW